MREVFTSQRLENVEGVADLLRAEGIEVRITNGRSYKGNRRGAFKYTAPRPGPQGAVWVVRSDDQPRARALLREAGLLATTRPGGTFVAGDPLDSGTSAPDPQRRALKIKAVLLLAIALVMMLLYVR